MGILIVLFVIAGGTVGYLNEFQASTSLQPSTPGLFQQAYGPIVPSSQSAVTFAATASSVSPLSGNYTASYGGRMVELQGYLTIQVEDPKPSSNRVIAVASALGGYVAESSFDQSGSTASLTVRVPEQNFSLALHELTALGKVEAQSISSNDVTGDYVNLQAQLTAYQTEESTLLRILNSANTVQDALVTEDSIAQVEAQINQIEGQLQVMQRLVAFATINIQLISPPQGPSLDLNDALQSAIISFYVVVKGMMIVGASLLPIAMLGGIAYYPYRRFSRKKTGEARLNDAG